MPSLMLEADFRNLPPGRVAFDEKSAAELGLEMGELCVISDENGLELGGAKVVIDPEVAPSHFGMEADMAKMLGIEQGFQYSLERYAATSQEPLRRVVLEVIDPDAGPAQGADVFQDHEKIARFLHDRVLHIGMRLRWRDLGYELVLKDTRPRLKGGEYAVFGDRVELELSASSNPFNGVILIDSSSSMLAKDIIVEPEIRPVLSQLYLMAETAMPELVPLLRKIDNGEPLTRLECAFLGAFQFLAEKMGRGLGENAALVTYSDAARLLGPEPGSEPFFRITQEGLIGCRDGKDLPMGAGSLDLGSVVVDDATNMESALELGRHAVERMRGPECPARSKVTPAVLVLLSDGVFTAGRSPAAVVKERIAPMESTVLHAVSIGAETDDPLLARCAQLGGGSFAKIGTLGEMVQFFSSRATSYGTARLTGNEAPKGALARTRELDACPKCGREDFVRSIDDRDGKMVQVVTCSVCGHRQEKLGV